MAKLENTDPYAPPPMHHDRSGGVVRIAIVAALLGAAAWGYTSFASQEQQTALVPVEEQQLADAGPVTAPEPLPMAEPAANTPPPAEEAAPTRAPAPRRAAPAEAQPAPAPATPPPPISEAPPINPAPIPPVDAPSGD